MNTMQLGALEKLNRQEPVFDKAVQNNTRGVQVIESTFCSPGSVVASFYSRSKKSHRVYVIDKKGHIGGWEGR